MESKGRACRSPRQCSTASASTGTNDQATSIIIDLRENLSASLAECSALFTRIFGVASSRADYRSGRSTSRSVLSLKYLFVVVRWSRNHPSGPSVEHAKETWLCENKMQQYCFFQSH